MFSIKNKLIKTLGADVVEELLANGAKLEELSKLVTNLKKLGLSDELISGFAKSFGMDGLDWLRKARGLNLSSDVITNLSKLDGFADKMDEILKLIKKSSRSADEVTECIIKHGDKAFDAIRKYGDDAVDAIVRHGDEATEVIGKYGDDAVDGLKQGKTPEEIEKELGNTGGEITSGLTKEKIQEILNTPKGSRPDPSTYLSKEYIDAHLEQFEDGISVIQTEWAYSRYSVTNGFVGVPDDNTLFVMPKNLCDDVVIRSNGDISIIEKELGFPEGYFSDGGGLVRIDVDDISGLNIRMPSGNETGVNSLWLPGGYTSGGIPEAVTDIIPLSKTKITKIDVN